VSDERLEPLQATDLSAGVYGWELASYYSPAGRTEVGGDFFDALDLGEGRLALFVGDVMGRGVGAAAAMAQTRASIRAFVAVDPTPAVLLKQLDLLFNTYGMTQLVTMVYMVLNPDRNELVAANAGHPPPVILRADGRTEQLPLANGAPLGIASGERESVTIEFHAGDTVMAFTDGLIERREEDIDKGQQRLLDNVPTFCRSSLADALPLIIEAVRDHTREDDVAALAVRQER
jgi:serine phosphatase RsbU (regulator of sigma subunit)